MRTNRGDITRLPSGSPPVLRALISGQVSIAELRAMRPLPENAQKLIDDAVVRVGLNRLSVVADLLAEGLTFDIGQDFWGITQIQWDEINEVGGAHRTMEPLARGENQLPDRRPRTIPVYLTWDDFELGIRTLSASQRGGAPLDVTLIEQATRRVNEAIEDSAVNGIPHPVFGGSVPGIMTAPNVNSFTYGTAGGATTAWDHPSKTGAQIVDDVLGLVAMARTNNRFGPFNLYINSTYGNALNKNYSDGVTTFPYTVLARIEMIMAGGRNIRVREADYMPTNRVALVQMTSDVIDVVVGQQPTVVNWEGPSGWDMHWVVLACLIPRVKTTYTDQSGIVIGNI